MKDVMKRAISFGKYLSRLRIRCGYSTRQLEYITGVTSSYISRLEHHKRATLPKISTINKLAAGLHVSPIRMYQIVGVKIATTFDLRHAIHDSVKITWGGNPLDRTDILAIKLWFNHKSNI